MALLAAYSFDEAGTTVTDNSGNGRSFTLSGTNGVRTASGHTNGGLTKSGTGMVDVAVPPFGQTANRTVMCWVKGNGTTWYVQWYVASIDSGAWGILSLDGVNVGAQARNAGGFVRALTPIPAGGDWHHYAATYDGSNVRFYLDGALAATSALAGPLRTDATELQIMEWTTGATIVDDLRIYDETLDAAAITTAMNTPVTAGDERTQAGAATITLAATGTQLAERTGSGTAGITLGATGTAVHERTAEGAAPLTLTATGTHAREAAGSGLAALTLGGDGAALREATRTGSAVLQLGALGTAAAERTQAGASVLTLVATGVAGDPQDITLTITESPPRWVIKPVETRWKIQEA